MQRKYFEDFTAEEQRDIKTAFRQGRSLTRKLIIYPAASVGILGALAFAKWEVLTHPVKDLPLLAQLALIEITPFVATVAAAAIPAYLISRKAAKATHQFNAILNSSDQQKKKILDRIIEARVQQGGTIIGTVNGSLIALIMGAAYIAIAPQPKELITPVAPIFIGMGLFGTGVLSMYNYMWQRSLRYLRNEISHLAGVINLEQDLSRPKITDRTKIDIPFTMK